MAKGVNRGLKGRPKGTKGRYKMVDPRMKKELRAFKRKAKRDGKKLDRRTTSQEWPRDTVPLMIPSLAVPILSQHHFCTPWARRQCIHFRAFISSCDSDSVLAYCREVVVQLHVSMVKVLIRAF